MLPIARPLFYDTVVLHSPAQAQAFSLAAPCAPRCAVPPPALLHRLFAHAPLRSLDVTLPATSHITPALVLAFNCECECDCAGEEELRITHLTLRKPPRAYLSTPATRSPRRRRTDPASVCPFPYYSYGCHTAHPNDDIPASLVARVAAGHHCILYPACAQTHRGRPYPAILTLYPNAILISTRTLTPPHGPSRAA
jgi:hypothetical protein